MEHSDRLPTAPALSTADVWRQIAVDAYGKEVESAATYSYTWLADQVGHMGLGILLAFATITLAVHLPGPSGGHLLPGEVLPLLVGFAVAVAMVCLWELSTYRSSVKQGAGGQFPIQIPLLRRNALVAALYMSLGAGMGLALHAEYWIATPAILALIAVAFAVAIPWVRQKMIWQKAALPYLNRMANLPPSMPDDVAAKLWAIVEAEPPVGRSGMPRHVVVAGQVGSGRTRLASSIGTEHAFRNRAVRYMPFSALADCAAARTVDTGQQGPSNINYWPWCQAQVLIVDDIGPFLAATKGDGETLEEALERLLDTSVGPIRDDIARRSTVWMVGELAAGGRTNLGDVTRAIGAFVKAGEAPLSVLLRPPGLPMTGLRPAQARPDAAMAPVA